MDGDIRFGIYLERIVAWRSFAAAALSIAISTTRFAWHCGLWSTSRRPDLHQDEARRIAANS
jgi:hypothetical protein